MIEANKATLKFYRTACRLIPTIVNRDGVNHFINPYQAMLNVAKWIRQNSNKNVPSHTNIAIVGAYDFLFDLAYGNTDWGMAMCYLTYGPQGVRLIKLV